ncbi:MAG TPA: hypothetical protein VEC36_01450 [Patescibacteria group bacterium]|nr:hypothetical protein [Patescibacteria group bacterium]
MKTLFSMLAFVAIGFCGCQLPPYVPQITAFKDPAYFAKTFQCVVVFADTSDLVVRQRIETAIAKNLDEDGVCATPAHLHLPPTRTWTLEDRKRFFDSNGVDSYLVVSVRNAGVDEEYIPPKVTTTRTTKNDKIEPVKDTTKKRDRTKTTEIEQEQITTQQSGGYTEYKPWIEYEVRLFDAKDDQTAWMAMRTVYPESHGALGNFYGLVSDRLIYDNVIVVDKNKKKRKNPFEIIDRAVRGN